MLALFVIWHIASEEYDKQPSLQASGPNPARNQWGFVLYQVQRRQDWVIEYTGYRLISKADHLFRLNNMSQQLWLQ